MVDPLAQSQYQTVSGLVRENSRAQTAKTAIEPAQKRRGQLRFRRSTTKNRI
jgi:hypothetical protein